MSKKPSFTINKEQRLLEAKKQLEQEDEQLTYEGKATQTTLILEESLLYDVKEVLLKRKRTKTKPYTLTGLVREYLKEIVAKEKI